MSQKQNKNQAKNTCIYFANGLRPDKLIAYKKIFAATKSLQIEHTSIQPKSRSTIFLPEKGVYFNAFEL